eukprot:gene10193-13712_t
MTHYRPTRLHSNFRNLGSFLSWSIIFLSLLITPLNCSSNTNLTSLFKEKKSYVWKNMTQHELSTWYSALDMCVLNSTNPFTFPQDTRARDCFHLSRGSRRMHCHVGMGNNHNPCFGPYNSARPSFLKGLEGFTNASSAPMIKVMDNLRKNNATLVFAGDSTMRQKSQALECELMREDAGYRFKGSSIYGVIPCNSTLTVTAPDGTKSQVIHVSLGPKSVECSKYWKVYSPRSPDATDIVENLKQIVKLLNDVNKSAVVIANTGLWYNTESSYHEVMPIIFDSLVDISNVPHVHNIVAWHETMTQHWISSDNSGYYDKGLSKIQADAWPWGNFSTIEVSKSVVPTCCRPVTNGSKEADWRNGIARQLLENKKYENIILVPFADITRPIADMHTCNPVYKHDCTHYCYWPLMWMPLWDQLQEITNLL